MIQAFKGSNPFILKMNGKKLSRKIKISCNILQNSLRAKKKYSYIPNKSEITKNLLSFLREKGFILGFWRKEEGYLIRLNAGEKKMLFSFHQGIAQRKGSRKSLGAIPYYSQQVVLIFSPQRNKLMSLEESYKLKIGGIIAGVLLLGE